MLYSGVCNQSTNHNFFPPKGYRFFALCKLGTYCIIYDLGLFKDLEAMDLGKIVDFLCISLTLSF